MGGDGDGERGGEGEGMGWMMWEKKESYGNYDMEFREPVSV